MGRNIEEIRKLLDEGKVHQAKKEIARTLRQRVPVRLKYDVAVMARQANLPSLAIRILSPIVHARHGVAEREPEKYVCEYAMSLTRIGASEEALEWIKRLESSKAPIVLLAKVFALISRWEYEASIPVLLEYVKSNQISDVQRVIGNLNLAAAYVYERYHENAERVLGPLITETRASKLQRFLGNALELSAQNALFQKKLDEASVFLLEAERLLKETDSNDELFIMKWKAVARLLAQGTPEALLGLRGFRAKAMERRHWETVRDCDRWEAVCQREEKLLTHIYFGTPYPSFRTRLLADSQFVPPSEYLWDLKKSGESSPRKVIDLLTGESKQGEELNKGKILHRLLTHLCADFYRPQRIASLHYRLYPGEHFNPLTSPARVHQAIKRLRRYFTNHRLPVTVDENSGGYYLKPDGPISIRIQADSAASSREKSLSEIVRRAVGDAEFSSHEIEQILGVSSRSARRVLSSAAEKGLVIKMGTGKGTKYRFEK